MIPAVLGARFPAPPMEAPMLPLRPCLAALLVLAACAAPGPERNDTRFAQVRAGMTAEEVRRIAGTPDETMPFPRAGQTSWGYYYFETWGYYALFSVTFGPDGRVASTFVRRLNDGGNRD